MKAETRTIEAPVGILRIEEMKRPVQPEITPNNEDSIYIFFRL